MDSENKRKISIKFKINNFENLKSGQKTPCILLYQKRMVLWSKLLDLLSKILKSAASEIIDNGWTFSKRQAAFIGQHQNVKAAVCWFSEQYETKHEFQRTRRSSNNPHIWYVI